MEIALQAVLPEALHQQTGIALADARRIVALVHRHGELPARSPATIRRSALDAVRRVGIIPQLTLRERRASSVDPFVKYAFELPDRDGVSGAIIETVRIPLEKPGRFAVCVSSQVGCALACAFCATGQMGLRRNLQTWEIVEQVRQVRADLTSADVRREARVHGVLFQGMGEPMANIERVIEAIRILGEPSAQAIDLRNVTVCTAGLPAGIRRLADALPQVRLGISLGSMKPTLRRTLMPIEKTHGLEDVLQAVAEHATKTGLSPLWAYTLLEGVNDSPDDAQALAQRSLAFARDTGIRPRLSLIPFNQIEGVSFGRSSDEVLVAFRDALKAEGVGSHVRYSGGGDIGAACGQLTRSGLDSAPLAR